MVVKIETYWNVNSVPAAPCLHPADLNRDILECKYSNLIVERVA